MAHFPATAACATDAGHSRPAQLSVPQAMLFIGATSLALWLVLGKLVIWGVSSLF